MKRFGFVTKGLAIVLAAGLLLSGCSDKPAEEEKSNLETSVSQEQTAASDDAKASTSEEGDDAKASAASDGSDATLDASKEDVVSLGGNSSAETSIESGDGVKYEDYFKNFSMEGKKMVLDCKASQDGMEMDFNMAAGSVGEQTYLSITSNDNEMTIYRLEDGSAYMYLSVGEMSQWYKTASLDKDSLSDVNIAEDFVNTDEEEMANIKYVGQETVEGVVYDVLTLAEDVEEGAPQPYYYVNVETKEFERFKASADGVDMNGWFEEMGDVSLPAAASSAQDMEADEFGMSMLFGMIAVMTGGQGLNMGE